MSIPTDWRCSAVLGLAVLAIAASLIPTETQPVAPAFSWIAEVPIVASLSWLWEIPQYLPHILSSLAIVFVLTCLIKNWIR